MSRKRLDVDWHKGIAVEDHNHSLKSFKRRLEECGLRASTIEMYVFRVGKYLEIAHTDDPTLDDLYVFSSPESLA